MFTVNICGDYGLVGHSAYMCAVGTNVRYLESQLIELHDAKLVSRELPKKNKAYILESDVL